MMSEVLGQRVSGVTSIPSIKASGVAQVDEVARDSVSSTGIGSGSSGSLAQVAALHAHCVRPVATHSGQNEAEELLDGSFEAILQGVK